MYLASGSGGCAGGAVGLKSLARTRVALSVAVEVEVEVAVVVAVGKQVVDFIES
jgi:hypothetical protein